MSHHTAIQYIEICGPTLNMEIELQISYTVNPGERETGPTYACGGTPAVPAFVEDLDFKAFQVIEEKHNGFNRSVLGPELDLTGWLHGFIESSIDEHSLLAEALEDCE